MGATFARLGGSVVREKPLQSLAELSPARRANCKGNSVADRSQAGGLGKKRTGPACHFRKNLCYILNRVHRQCMEYRQMSGEVVPFRGKMLLTQFIEVSLAHPV